MITTTTPTLQGREISEYLGVLYAFDSTQYTDRSAPNAIGRAMAQLEKLAEDRGADALVDVKHQYDRDEKTGTVYFVVSGTAVKLK
ncbi:MAG: heavy metal-binding domain-containing protein [Butyricicoccaceae bacterium]